MVWGELGSPEFRKNFTEAGFALSEVVVNSVDVTLREDVVVVLSLSSLQLAREVL